MTTYSNDISNMSYTNKDFGTIYPELLEIAQKLSYKWDPTTSDESDPGVVLLKLAAIVADKNNYNIDKSVLETFPASVTQLDTARQLFEQLGYSMRHYITSEVTVSMSLTNEPDLAEVFTFATEDSIDSLYEYPRSYDLPRFTMVSDVNNEVVYTITEPIYLSSDKKQRDFPAVQGVIQDLTMNGDSVLLPSSLDYHNRIYFPDYAVAENGIFITHSDRDSYHLWTAVDNLSIQPTGTFCYKFGITPGTNQCYLEFPSDAENLIESGICIKYVLTSGREGNISKNVLKKLFTDVTATATIADLPSIQPGKANLTGDNISIYNSSSSSTGRNPETIDEAYYNYEKIKTTFDTLVSLKDYTNYLTRQDFKRPYSSNGFVCDRTNDIQSTYEVIDREGEIEVVLKTYEEEIGVGALKKTDGSTNQEVWYKESPEMTAFDLRLYALHYSGNQDNYYGFSKSFEIQLEDANDIYGINGYKMDIEKVKCIQHDFKSFELDRPIIFKNIYPIEAKIIPQYKVDTRQMLDIMSNVENALCKNLNASKLKFGESPDYSTVYDTILGADNRIKALILNELSYNTYAIYTPDGKKLESLRIDDNSTPPNDKEVKKRELWNTFRKDICCRAILKGVTPLYTSDNAFKYTLAQKEKQVYKNVETIDSQVTLGLNKRMISSGTVREDFVELLTNENLVFTMPNLIKENEYSSYVKYIISVKSDIPANTEYQLTGDDFIIFFRKAANTDEHYEYYKYDSSNESAATFICPTFKLDKSNISGIGDIGDVMKALDVGKGDTSGITVTIDGSEVAFSKYMSEQTKSTFVLMGQDMIATKYPNTELINDPESNIDRATWYLGSSSKDTPSVLFNKGETERILQNGEYFIYSNKSKSRIISLGAGTKIHRKLSTTYSGTTEDLPEWSCGYFEYAAFLNNVDDYLDDKSIFVPMPVDYEIYSTEMQFYQLGPGNTVRIDWDKSQLATEDDGTDDSSLIDKYKNDRLFIDKHSAFIVHENEEEDAETPYSFKKFSFKGKTISYSGESGVLTKLPSRDCSPEYNWSVYTGYNIDCSPNKSQRLESAIGDGSLIEDGDRKIYSSGLPLPTGEYAIPLYRDQIVTLYYHGETIKETGKLDSADISNSSILMDREIIALGGDSIQVAQLSLMDGSAQYLNVYNYDEVSLPGGDKTSTDIIIETKDKDENDITSSGLCTVSSINGGFKIKADIEQKSVTETTPVAEGDSATTVFSTSTVTFKFKAPNGEYILPIHQAGKIDDISIKGYKQGVEKSSVASAIRGTLSLDEGYLYYKLNIADVDSLTLTVVIIHSNEAITTVEIEPLYKVSGLNFGNNVVVDSSDPIETILLNQIKSMDIDDRYDYVYDVPSDKIIENPLSSDSFTDENHPYNRATMCEWDVNNNLTANKIEITNKIK